MMLHSASTAVAWVLLLGSAATLPAGQAAYVAKDSVSLGLQQRQQPAAAHVSHHKCAPGLHPAFTTTAALKDLIARLPKAELHIHVEGTLEPGLMMALAHRNNVQLPYKDLPEAIKARSSFSCLQDFLDAYNIAMSALRTKQDFADVAAAYLEQARRNNITHVELFFDAQSHVDRGVAWADVVGGLQLALEEAASHPQHPISSALILCLVREKSLASAAAALMRALPYRPTIQTLGLASAELGYPPKGFQAVYSAARAFHLKRVAHAGEEGGADYIWQAIKLLGVSRVDHGVHCLEDERLVKYMVQHQMPITLCPLSNLHLQVYQGVLEAKLCDLVNTGIPITVNSDDPAFLGGYLNTNYAWLAQATGLGPHQLAQLAKNSFNASFIPEAAKQQHMDAVDAALKAWQAEQRQQA